ncbi:hypothetical protein BGZ74_008010 [Mortierella antarctica]|nr:hypothetical protein BGZ74_008010 [Mortierella antarctica]
MSQSPFHILIVGAGVSGLFLAFLLEHAHVGYTVIERQSEADYNLKGILQLTATSMSVIDQLGLLPEYMALAKVSRAVSLYKSDMQFVGHFSTTHHERHFGYPCTLITRMAFCRLLLSKIPKEKIRWKQHITEIVHGDLGVSVHCTDGSTIISTSGVGSSSSSSPPKAKRFGRSFDDHVNDLRDLGLHPPVSSSFQSARNRYMSAAIQYYGPNSHVQYRAPSKAKPWSPLRCVRYDGNILIGADGAYSRVRQSLYDRIAVVRRKMDLKRALHKANKQHKSPDSSLCLHQHRHQNRRSMMECASGALERISGWEPSLTASSSSDSAAASFHSDFETLATLSVRSSSLYDGPRKPSTLRRSRSLGALRGRGGQKPVSPRISSRPEVLKADKTPLRVTEIAVTGITEHLNHDTFPEAASQFADVKLIGDKDCNYSIFTTSLGDNSVIWSVLGPVTHSGKALDGNFGQSEWGVEMAEALMSRCRDFKSPYGGVLGDLFDRTPKSTICKYMIEEKLFSTWYFGRTCLMGDGESAIADAACLASMITHLPTDPTSDMITRAFECYREQRYSQVKVAMYWSREFGRTIVRKGRVSDFVRRVLCKMPQWAQHSLIHKIYYPKIHNVSFLPRVTLNVSGSGNNKCQTRIEAWDSEQIVQRIRGTSGAMKRKAHKQD